METILQLLTTEDKTEMKEAMKKIVMEKFEFDFHDYYDKNWIFDPKTIDTMVEEAMVDAKEEAQRVLTAKLSEQMMNKISKIELV